MNNCNCYACKPNTVPEDYDGKTCSICFTPLGGYPAGPQIGSMCLACARKYSSQNKHPVLLDPYYRTILVTCPDEGCGQIITLHNFAHHFNAFPTFNEKSKAIAARRIELELIHANN